MILTEHIVKSEQQQLDVNNEWFKYTTERLQEVLITVCKHSTVSESSKTAHYNVMFIGVFVRLVLCRSKTIHWWSLKTLQSEILRYQPPKKCYFSIAEIFYMLRKTFSRASFKKKRKHYFCGEVFFRIGY